MGQERDALQQSGNLTLLERPVGTATLVSAVRAALRARGRQYEVHDALEALDGQRAPLPHPGRSATATGLDQPSRMASATISAANGSNTPASLRKSNSALPGSTRSSIPQDRERVRERWIAAVDGRERVRFGAPDPSSRRPVSLVQGARNAGPRWRPDRQMVRHLHRHHRHRRGARDLDAQPGGARTAAWPSEPAASLPRTND